MARTYRKNILRTFKSTRSRFLAVFSIVALGVGFLAGLSATPVDMKNSMEEYMDAGNFYDLRVLSTLGLTGEDVQALQAVEGVEAVQPAYSADLLVKAGEADTVVARAHSLPPQDGINRLRLVEGRLPATPGECVVEAGANEMNRAFAVGSTFLVGEDNEDLDEKLAVTEFTVVGIVHNTNYFSFEREPASVGNGTISLVFYIQPEAFAYEAYTEIYLTAAGARELFSLEEDYQAVVDALARRIEDIEDVRCQARYDGIRSDARAELDDAWAEYNDAAREADEELADAARELADGRRELADGEQEYLDGERDYRDGLQALSDNEKLLADGVEQIAAARRQLEEGQAAWDEGWKQFKDGEAQLGEAKRLLDEGQRQYDEGKARYDAALAQIEDGEAQLADAKTQLDEAQRRYDEGKAQYDAALAQIEDGEARLAEAKAQLDEGQRQYDDGVRQLVEQANQNGLALTEEQANEWIGALAALDPTEIPQDPYELLRLIAQKGGDLLPDTLPPEVTDQIDETLQTINNELEGLKDDATQEEREAIEAVQKLLNKVTAEELQAALDDLRERLDQIAGSETPPDSETWERLKELLDKIEKPALPEDLQKLLDGLLQLVEARRQLDAGWTQYNENAALLAAGRAELEASLPALEEGKAQLDAGWAQYNENAALLASGRAELEASLPALEGAKAQLDAGWAEYEAGGAKLYEGKRQLEETRQTLADGWATLADKQLELADAQRRLAEGRQTLADARRTLDDARATIAENKQKLLDGEIEYADAKAEAEEKLADARRELEDAEAELDSLKYPEWYVWDRSHNVSFSSFDANVAKLQAITTIFPLFFFLVAALVVSTTMTRMIEEERLQIGTMKALGYTRGEIMKKYLWYALIAAAAGTVFGLAVGFYAFPTIIWSAYQIMYYMPVIHVPWLPDKAIFAGGTLIALTVGITALACRSSLAEVPASLMLPRAPKAGKRIFLEHIGPLWRRLPFTWKVTCRNLLRYKKRFWMTVIGVAGCTALLVTGFGIADSLDAIASNQYGRIYHYDLTTAVAHPEDTRTGEVYDYLFGPDFNASLATATEKLNQHTPGGETVECYLLVPQDLAAFPAFADLHERISGKGTPLGEQGVVLTEKFAAAMGVQAGDTVTLENADGVQAAFTVTGVCEHYVYNYAYISAAAYQAGFGTAPAWNTILTQLPDTSQAVQDGISARLLAMEDVAGVSFTTDQMTTVLNMLNAIDAVVVLIIVCAAALAFVVLYNLSNINIAERVKEIATIKVLGFYDREVDSYINRESVALTFIGALLGLVLGIWLHRFIIVTVEVDAVMFGRDIAPISFVYALVLTMLFGAVINFIMGRRLRRVSMVESMKAPE